MYIYFEYTFTKKRMKKWMQFIQHRRLIQQFDLYILRCYVWSLILLHTWNFEGTVGRRSMDLRMKLLRSIVYPIVYTPMYHMYLHTLNIYNCQTVFVGLRMNYLWQTNPGRGTFVASKQLKMAAASGCSKVLANESYPRSSTASSGP